MATFDEGIGDNFRSSKKLEKSSTKLTLWLYCNPRKIMKVGATPLKKCLAVMHLPNSKIAQTGAFKLTLTCSAIWGLVIHALMTKLALKIAK